jgi:hypothetical protein
MVAMLALYNGILTKGRDGFLVFDCVSLRIPWYGACPFLPDTRDQLMSGSEILVSFEKTN